jgi:AcrR family transcriptional regulator
MDRGRAAASDTVNAIVAAGYRLIERDGMLDLNMRELLAEARSSNRAFYRHFASKDVFLMTLVDELYKDVLRDLEQQIARHEDPVAQMKTWIDRMIEPAADPDRARLGRPFVVHAARLEEQFPEVYSAIGHRLVGQLQAVIERGVARRTFVSCSPRRDARMVFQLTLVVMQSHVLARTLIKRAERDAVVNFSLRALGAI